MNDKKDQLLRKEALEYHEESPKGKIKVVPTKPHTTAHELSLAYSPGVAYPCLEIAERPEDAAVRAPGGPSDPSRGPARARGRCQAGRRHQRRPASASQGGKLSGRPVHATESCRLGGVAFAGRPGP